MKYLKPKLFECMKDYYLNITEEQRVQQFRNTTFANNCTEANVLSRLKNNTYITFPGVGLASNYGVTISNDNEVCMACIKAFVNYINSK